MTPVRIPAAVLAHAQTTVHAVSTQAHLGLDTAELLGGRAALLGLTAGGQVSAGGASRLLSGRDGAGAR